MLTLCNPFAQELVIFFVGLRLRGRASPTLTGTFADAFIKLVSHLTWMWNWWKPPLRWRNQNLGSNRFTGHAFHYGLGCQRWLHLFLQLCLVASTWKKNTTGEDCSLGFGQRTRVWWWPSHIWDARPRSFTMHSNHDPWWRRKRIAFPSIHGAIISICNFTPWALHYEHFRVSWQWDLWFYFDCLILASSKVPTTLQETWCYGIL